MYVHLHHGYAPDGPREFNIVTAQEAADAWEAGAQGATTKWANNLQRTTKPIVAAAIAQKSVMVQNYQQAVNSGRWQQGLEAVGDQGIKAAAAAKSGNFGTGVSNSKPKYLAKIGPLLGYIAQGLPQLESMPSGTTQAGINRASFWIQYMAAGKGL